MCLVAKHVLPWDRNKPLSHRCTLYINVARYLGVKVGVPMDANSIHRVSSKKQHRQGSCLKFHTV